MDEWRERISVWFVVSGFYVCLNGLVYMLIECESRIFERFLFIFCKDVCVGLIGFILLFLRRDFGLWFLRNLRDGDIKMGGRFLEEYIWINLGGLG